MATQANPTRPPSMVWTCVRLGRPFMRAYVGDDQVDELLTELTTAVEHFGTPYSVHLVEDLGGPGSWTVIAHPLGIHHFPTCGLNDGAHS